MTEQRLFSNQRLIRLIIPLIIEQALTILVGMCDGVMVSSVGEAAISGVSLVDMINNVILVLFAALATGGAVVTSQFLGARQGEKARQSAGQLVLMSAVLGVAAAALCLVFAKNLMRLFFGSIDDDVMAAGLTYLHITALSFPFIALYNAGAAIFRSVGNSKVSMQVSLLMNGINVVGNAICIFVLKMGVAGVAVPTVVSRCVAAVVILLLAANPKQELCLKWGAICRADGKMMGSILRIGVPNACENSLFQLGRLIVVSMIALFGTVQTSAKRGGEHLGRHGYHHRAGYGTCHGDGGRPVRGRGRPGAGQVLRKEADALVVSVHGRVQCPDYRICRRSDFSLQFPVARDGGVDEDAGHYS